MINILVLLEMIDFQPEDRDEGDLHKYLNYELNGIECEYENKIPKFFKNLLKQVKELLP
jgi:hypothetical protein